MTVKDVKKLMASAMDCILHTCNSKEDAVNEISTSRYTFNIYTNLSDYYGNMKVVLLYASSKDQLEVWAVQ